MGSLTARVVGECGNPMSKKKIHIIYFLRVSVLRNLLYNNRGNNDTLRHFSNAVNFFHYYHKLEIMKYSTVFLTVVEKLISLKYIEVYVGY
jgi:hypothetical protein